MGEALTGSDFSRHTASVASVAAAGELAAVPSNHRPLTTARAGGPRLLGPLLPPMTHTVAINVSMSTARVERAR